eukprot:TRINITY_DN15890_c0_g2_i1.p1 TRINITY_DN15890_c0_g2~~TRINITY_DN15890_c0_g2_i1.p1  ORF type:complete len:666 (-),score=170.51 TRINITY_DN15890_c0_g2_i1:74-2071(-)
MAGGTPIAAEEGPSVGHAAMPPPSLPAKRGSAVARSSGGDGEDDVDAAESFVASTNERSAKRPKLGEELPDTVSKEDIERMLDEADDVHIETMNEVTVKRMSLQLERKIKRNQEMRIKHADEPEKFLKSEVDLDEDLKKFTIVATHPELFGDLLEHGAVPLLVGLLSHANTDIAVDVFEVLSELTEHDVISEIEEPERFVNALFEAQLCDMTVDVLLRINEADGEEEAKAVTNCLTMIENLTDIMPQETCLRFSKVPRLLPWLMKRVRAAGAVDYNRVYASEILGIFLQSSAASREAMVRFEGVDKLLRGIAVYRKRDPEDSEESEFAQNMFDCLCSLMLLKEHQVFFGSVQGLDLMIRMMRERKFAGSLALRLVDHALRHCAENCQLFVEKLGLKVLFAHFMKKGPQVKGRSAALEQEEHVVSILQSLCRYCTGTPVARVLNKFTEGNFEKLERLLELHEEYSRSVREADTARLRGETEKIDRDLEVDEDEQLYLDRCDAGLFTLQQVDLVIVRLANMGNRQVADELSKLMDIKGVPLQEVLDSIQEYRAHLDVSASEEGEQLQSFCASLCKRAGIPAPHSPDSPKEAEELEPWRDERRPEKKDKKGKKENDRKVEVQDGRLAAATAALEAADAKAEKRAKEEKLERKEKEKKPKKKEKEKTHS